jgi:hypothetical protein
LLAQGAMLAESVESFYALALGFALAGLLASGYQLATERPASFRLLERGPCAAAFAAVPFLAFAAPFIIMRTSVRASRVEGSSAQLVTAATVVAGLWSLMSGTVAVSLLTAAGVIGT